MPSPGGAGLWPHSRLGVREERGSVESDLSGRSGRKFLPGQVLRVLSDAPGLVSSGKRFPSLYASARCCWASGFTRL